MAPRMRELIEAGEKFLQHLNDTGRMNVTSKEELRSIYGEFKIQHGPLPNFSSVIYGLKETGKAFVRRNSIHLRKVVRRRSRLADQYIAIQHRQDQVPLPTQPGQDGNNYTRKEAQRIIQWMKENRQEFIQSKNGIVIKSGYDLTDGRIRFPLQVNEPKTVTVSIDNTSDEAVTFVQYKLLRKMRVFSLQDEQQISAVNTKILNPGDVYDVSVTAETAYYGYFPVTIVFQFTRGNVEFMEKFLIGRFISAVSNSRLADDLAPTSRYTPYQRNLTRTLERIEDDGIQPDRSVAYSLEKEIPLGNFPVPSYLRDDIRNGLFSSRSTWSGLKLFLQPLLRLPLLSAFGGQRLGSSISRNLLISTLEFSNYPDKFHLLLHLEEIQMEIDIRKYDKERQTMERDRNLLILDVPGVAENRPSVLKGDHLFVTLSNEPESPSKVSYKGYVHGVELERVKLGFSQNLLQKFISGMLFDVTFTFNRMPLKVQHRAVDLAKKRNLQEYLFPTGARQQCIVNTDNLRLYDQNLENNQEQYMAVKQIVSGFSRPAPYLIFGPPGTGKTVTLVEAIKQVLKNIPECRVLACAPSNSASDLICERLMKHIDKKDIYRMMASSRDFRFVPEMIKPCCNWNDTTQEYEYPCKSKLMEYKVIITTLITAGRLVSAQFPDGHFTHVFIDESGHAVEPECVTAIAGILDVTKGGQLVLAGDPQQLGPVLRAPFAIEHGLSLSLLERLMTQNPLYEKSNGAYNPQFVTKLLLNYRSHPDILSVPNELFYDNELQAKADEMVTRVYCNWEKLPKKNFPLIFHHVLGKDEREGNSPSFFNVHEIEVLVSYLRDLLETQGKKGIAKISPKEIGIIAPYRKQVEKIRKAIDKEFRAVTNIKDLKIGSVEEFQGQERRVILISTVRSSMDYVKLDEDFSLGFLKNPKRFNVSITRAKALLIMIGNSIILRKDPNWSRFLKFCCDKGGHRGFQADDLEDLDDTELADLFGNMNVNEPQPSEPSGESVVQQQGEPAWRHEH
ncbi:putative helicase MOV-10 [Bufo gargarizans]|uniref:putative helicase MOV-10 n=1 Tax=Bufo gargarizans TaxID=30331 RepID=UPI001CF13B65|nr:putative helicase MOV-10 [Bufo gargarizans]